jgi:dephospho-CoA kinase
MSDKVLKIVLTGTIGSGKSVVAKYFAELGAAIIDSDVIVRDLLSNDAEIITKIKQHFGAVVIADGALQRKVLREIVFNKASEKQWLEALLHPLVFKAIDRQLAEIKTGYCIIIIPLFLETCERYKIADRVLVVDAPREQQIIRTMKRDNIAKAMVQKILEQQADSEKLLACADDIIINNNSLDELKKQVEKLHLKYKNISETIIVGSKNEH